MHYRKCLTKGKPSNNIFNLSEIEYENPVFDANFSSVLKITSKKISHMRLTQTEACLEIKPIKICYNENWHSTYPKNDQSISYFSAFLPTPTLSKFKIYLLLLIFLRSAMCRRQSPMSAIDSSDLNSWLQKWDTWRPRWMRQSNVRIKEGYNFWRSDLLYKPFYRVFAYSWHMFKCP